MVRLAKRMEMPAASGWHSHHAVQWICADGAVVTLETEAGQWVALPGQAFLVASNVMHNVSWRGAVMIDTVYLEPEAIAFGPEVVLRLTDVSPLLSACVSALMEERPPYPGDAVGRTGLLVGLILDEMGRRDRPLFGLPNPTSRPLSRLCQDLRERPSDARDINAWADALGTTRRTLTRKFRLETGLSFVAWRRRSRVIHALKLEVEGVAAKQAAFASGYASVQALRLEQKKAVEESAGASFEDDD